MKIIFFQLTRRVHSRFYRVKYREERYLEKMEEKKRKAVAIEIEKEEQEKRLEALREKVRPDVSH